MELKQWIDEFSRLHSSARKGNLSEADKRTYLDRREELARALVTAQQLTLQPGQTPRQALRVSKALQIELELPSGRVRVITQNISTGGFGALVGQLPPSSESIGFSLKQPGAVEPIVGRCRVREAQAKVGSSLVSFVFEDLTENARDRIEMTIFDAVMEQFQRTSTPPPTK
jgi:hypothetical protein